MAPNLYTISKKKNRTPSDALQNSNWVQDIDFMHRSISARHFTEYISLWRIAQQVTLQPNIADTVTWKLIANGEYTTRSAYQAQFLGSTANNFNKLINANSLDGSRSRTGCGLQTGWLQGVGPTMEYASCAVAFRNRAFTSSGTGRHGQPPLICALKTGPQVPRFMNGGHQWCRPHHQHLKGKYR